MLAFLRLTLACAAVCFAGSSFAQELKCKGEIVATGNGALTEAGAKDKAVRAWRTQVITSLGVFYGEFANANDGKGGVVERCARSLLGLQVCQARGRPCEAPAGGTEIKCTDRDSRNCDPTVKWVQSRLNAKNFDVTVDGAPGPRTERAIRAYRKSVNAGDSSEIDDKLIDALKS